MGIVVECSPTVAVTVTACWKECWRPAGSAVALQGAGRSRGTGLAEAARSRGVLGTHPHVWFVRLSPVSHAHALLQLRQKCV